MTSFLLMYGTYGTEYGVWFVYISVMGRNSSAKWMDTTYTASRGKKRPFTTTVRQGVTSPICADAAFFLV